MLMKMVLCPNIPVLKGISKRKKSELRWYGELSEDILSNTTLTICFLFSLSFYNPKRDNIFNIGKRRILITRIIMQTSCFSASL